MKGIGALAPVIAILILAAIVYVAPIIFAML